MLGVRKTFFLYLPGSHWPSHMRGELRHAFFLDVQSPATVILPRSLPVCKATRPITNNASRLGFHMASQVSSSANLFARVDGNHRALKCRG